MNIPDPHSVPKLEVVWDIAPDNAARPELYPSGQGMTIKLMKGENAPHRLVVISSLSAADTERLLMSTLSAIGIAWRPGGEFISGGDDPSTRDDSMIDKLWRPWK